jgi:hypothetical protein
MLQLFTSEKMINVENVDYITNYFNRANFLLLFKILLIMLIRVLPFYADFKNVQ